MKYFSILIKTFLTILIISLLIYSVGWNKILNSFRLVNRSNIVKAAALVPVIMILGALKWFFFLRGHGLKVSYFKAFRSFFFGMGIGVFTPGKAGEFARILLIPDSSALNLAALVIYDRLIDLAAVILLAMFSVYYFFGTMTGFWYMFGTFVVLFLIMERRILFGGFRNILKKVPPLAPIVKERSVIIELGLDTVSICFLIRLILSIVDLFQFYLLISAFHSIYLIEVLLCYPPMLLISVLPFTISGLGIRESF